MRKLVPVFIWLIAAFVWGMVFMTWLQQNAEYLPPCKTEDSSHCYWDAETQGNGQGNDVVNP
jgi:uncharacterized protein YfaQ (DUF2300 family)